MNVDAAIERVREFIRARGITQSQLARDVCIPQSTVSRALDRPRRFTKTHRKLCKYACIPIDELPGAADGRQGLIDAVLEMWDGSPERHRAILELLKAGAAFTSDERSKVHDGSRKRSR